MFLPLICAKSAVFTRILPDKFMAKLVKIFEFNIDNILL